MKDPASTSHYGTAEKAFVFLAILMGIIWSFKPITAHGVLNWYVTGFDDLLIFSVIYLDAKKNRRGMLAIFGLLSAVACMIAFVAIAGETVRGLGEYAKFSATIPIGYALWTTWRMFHEKSEEAETPDWWMRYATFWKAFFGFAANCLDDIALNASMVAGVYAEHATEYLSGVALGAITMVVLARVVGKRIGEYPFFQIAGYLLAAGIILSSG